MGELRVLVTRAFDRGFIEPPLLDFLAAAARHGSLRPMPLNGFWYGSQREVLLAVIGAAIRQEPRAALPRI
jgi:hypothetical protein